MSTVIAESASWPEIKTIPKDIYKTQPEIIDHLIEIADSITSVKFEEVRLMLEKEKSGVVKGDHCYLGGGYSMRAPEISYITM